MKSTRAESPTSASPNGTPPNEVMAWFTHQMAA